MRSEQMNRFMLTAAAALALLAATQTTARANGGLGFGIGIGIGFSFTGSPCSRPPADPYAGYQAYGAPAFGMPYHPGFAMPFQGGYGGYPYCSGAHPQIVDVKPLPQPEKTPEKKGEKLKKPSKEE
jgi:hypothetical protein